MTYAITLAGPRLGPELILALDEACTERKWRLLSAHIDEQGLQALVRARASASSVARTLAKIHRLRLLGSLEWKSAEQPVPPAGRTAFFVAAQ